MRLPKGIEHFLSDIHGEYDAFCYIINNCSGVIREKIEILYGDVMSERDRDEFATLIYYPSQIIAEMKSKNACFQVYAKQSEKISSAKLRLHNRRIG